MIRKWIFFKFTPQKEARITGISWFWQHQFDEFQLNDSKPYPIIIPVFNIVQKTWVEVQHYSKILSVTKFF